MILEGSRNNMGKETKTLSSLLRCRPRSPTISYKRMLRQPEQAGSVRFYFNLCHSKGLMMPLLRPYICEYIAPGYCGFAQKSLRRSRTVDRPRECVFRLVVSNEGQPSISRDDHTASEPRTLKSATHCECS